MVETVPPEFTSAFTESAEPTTADPEVERDSESRNCPATEAVEPAAIAPLADRSDERETMSKTESLPPTTLVPELADIAPPRIPAAAAETQEPNFASPPAENAGPRHAVEPQTEAEPATAAPPPAETERPPWPPHREPALLRLPDEATVPTTDALEPSLLKELTEREEVNWVWSAADKPPPVLIAAATDKPEPN